MKKVVFITLSIFFCFNISGQKNKMDSAVNELIKSKKHFVALIDSSNLPIRIKPYYLSVLTYLSDHKLNKQYYYVSSDCIQETAESIFIPIYHYDGFKKELKLEIEDKELNKSRSKGEQHRSRAMMGNASGKDGYLEIDKSSKCIISFKF